MKQLRVLAGIVLMFLMMNVSVMAAEVFMPHLTGGFADWGDYLTVDNTGVAPASVTVILYDDTGTQVYSGAHVVGALGESVIDLKQLSSTAQSGKVTYSGDTLYFRLSLLNNVAGGVAEFRLMGIQSSVLGFFFSDFESVVDWKGIALTNYGASEAAVTLFAIGGGRILGTANLAVPPYSKVSGTHSTWFSDLNMNEVKKIIAVSPVAVLGGIAIASNAASSSMLFTAAVPMESFSAGELIGDFTGVWRGEWDNGGGYSGDIVMRLIQIDDQVEGTADIDDTDCGNVRNMLINGTVSNDMIAFDASFKCGQYLATLAFTQGSRRGDTIFGSYQENVNGAFYDSGTFWLTKD